jgi:hypothetical protein
MAAILSAVVSIFIFCFSRPRPLELKLVALQHQLAVVPVGKLRIYRGGALYVLKT